MRPDRGWRQPSRRRARSPRRWATPGGVRPARVVGRGSVLVATERQVWSIAACLLSQQREQPVLGLAVGGGVDQLGLSPVDVRAVVGPLPRIYVLNEERLLAVLAGLVGRPFALLAGTARIWWPGLALANDPAAHPLVIPLVDESGQGVRAEFARVFDLSRPVVRREIAEIEGARRQAEDQLRQARNGSRESQAPVPQADWAPSSDVDIHGRRPSERLRAAASRSVWGCG